MYSISKISLIVFPILVLSVIFSCKPKNENSIKVSKYIASTKNNDLNKDIPQFTLLNNDIYNFGKIRAKERIKFVFEFENTGNSPLIIQNVIPSCGCTIANYSKVPIQPGGKGEISGFFRSNESDIGVNIKSMRVIVNDKNENYVLYLKGEVY